MEGVKEREGGEEVRRKKSITKSVASAVPRVVGKRCSMHRQEVLSCSRMSDRREKRSDGRTEAVKAAERDG